MSPVAIGLDLVLVGLLVSALYVGLRLNRQLKALRAGQTGFILAVSELDGAAARAESGLKALRAASEDTHDALLTRIETARALIARLESAGEAAERALAAQPAAPARPVARPAALGRHAAPAPEPPAPRAAARPDPRFRIPRPPAAREVDADLFEAEPAEPFGAFRRGLGARR